MRRCGFLDLDELLRRSLHPGHGGARDLSRRGAGNGGSRRPRFCLEADEDRRRAFRLEGDEPVEIGATEKMSKSKRNTVDPDEIIETYGADTARWFMLSDSLPERDVIWTEAGVQGAFFKQTQRPMAPDLRNRTRRRTGPSRAPPADYGDQARRIRRIAHATRSPRSRMISSGCVSMSASRRSTNSPTSWSAAVGAIDQATVADDLRYAALR